MTESTGPAETPRPEFWQACSLDTVDLCEWGDEFVVRVGSSAKTHLLSAATGSVLRALREASGPIGIESLFSDVFGESTDAAMTAAERLLLRDVVVDLERLGLVTRSAP